jgi:hypothetical protein
MRTHSPWEIWVTRTTSQCLVLSASGNRVAVSRSESCQSRCARSGSRAAAERLMSSGAPRMWAKWLGRRSCFRGYRRRPRRGRGGRPGPDHELDRAPGAVVDLGRDEAGMCCLREHIRADGLQAPLELGGEQEVGQLGLVVSARPLVTAMLEVRVVEVDAAEPLGLGGDRHHPAVVCSRSRLVRAKWPRWLVPNRSSNPSAVRRSSGTDSPALLTRRSTGPSQAAAKDRTESRLARSSWRTSVVLGVALAAAQPCRCCARRTRPAGRRQPDAAVRAGHDRHLAGHVGTWTVP